MDKKGSMEMVLFGLVAVIAVIGLVMQFSGSTGSAAGDPMTRQLLPNEENFRIERPLGWRCECQTKCVYDARAEFAKSALTQYQPQASASCEKILAQHCAPQPVGKISMHCEQTVN